MRSKPERIGSFVHAVVKQAQEQSRPLVTIQQGWVKLVGRRLAAHTKPVSLRRGRLIVLADRPGDSFALSYQRAQLLERLDADATGRVEEIVIRPGEPKPAKTKGRRP